jgi:hypothetical protein
MFLLSLSIPAIVILISEFVSFAFFLNAQLLERGTAWA